MLGITLPPAHRTGRAAQRAAGPSPWPRWDRPRVAARRRRRRHLFHLRSRSPTDMRALPAMKDLSRVGGRPGARVVARRRRPGRLRSVRARQRAGVILALTAGFAPLLVLVLFRRRAVRRRQDASARRRAPGGRRRLSYGRPVIGARRGACDFSQARVDALVVGATRSSISCVHELGHALGATRPSSRTSCISSGSAGHRRVLRPLPPATKRARRRHPRRVGLSAGDLAQLGRCTGAARTGAVTVALN